MRASRLSQLVFSIGLAVLLALGSCQRAPANPTAAPLARPSRPPTSTRPPAQAITPYPTRTPTSTPGPDERAAQEAERLLRINPYKYNLADDYTLAVVPYAVRLLDFLYRQPEAPERLKLTEALVDYAGYLRGPLVLDWLVDAWLDETILQPFDRAGGPPAGFAAQWQTSRGQIIETDLDTDGEPDYLLTLSTLVRDGSYEAQGGLYWLHRQQDRFTFEMIEIVTFTPRFDIVATQDLNGDGFNDLAYATFTCDASACRPNIHLVTRANGQWRRLAPVLTAGFQAINGGWRVWTAGEATIELVGAYGGPGQLSVSPRFPYQIHFQLQRGEFTPVKISAVYPPERWGEDAARLEWAETLVRARRFDDALQVLTAQPTFSGPLPAFDYTPYALFRTGMVSLYRRDTAAALQAWDRLIADYPDHPLSQDVAQLSGIVQQPEDIWRVCQWLDQNPPDWTPPGLIIPETPTVTPTNPIPTETSAPSPSPSPSPILSPAISLTLTATITATATIEPPVSTPLPTPTAATKLLSLLPAAYTDPFRVGEACNPLTLIPWQTWTVQEPLETQAGRLGLPWQMLSANYDLNGDGAPDEIGLLDRQPWVFLSEGDRYRPLYAAQPLPVESLGLVEVEMVDFALAQEFRITDLDSNQQPELLISFPNGLAVFEWLGHRFTHHVVAYTNPQTGETYTGQATLLPQDGGQTQVQVTFSEPAAGWVYALQDGVLTRLSPPPAEVPANPLTAALDALFRDRDPQLALAILDGYIPQDAWSQAAAAYLGALALDYTGQTDAAQAEYSRITEEFRWTPWAILAREKLKPGK